MKDELKTKAQLIRELESLRRAVAASKRIDSPNRPLPHPLPDREPPLQTIINNLLSGMIYQVVRRPDGSRVFTYLSDTVRRFYGIAPEEGLADASLIYDKVYERDRARVFQEEEEAHRTLRPFRSEVRMMGPDGGMRWSLFVSHPRRLEDGATCWDGIQFDITERKKAEEALRVSEEKFSKIFKTIPDAVAIARWRDGVYVDVNESYAQVSGYSKEELIGHSPLPGDLNLWVRSEDRAPFAAALKETGQALGLEIQFRHKSGAIRNALLSARVLEWEGEPYHVAIIRDITESKRTGEILRASEEKFSRIFTTIPDPVCIIRLSDGVFLEVNESFLRVTGYSRAEIVGRPYHSGHPDFWIHRKDRVRLVVALRETGEVLGMETPFRAKGGRVIYGLISARTLEINGAVCIVGIVNDITEQKKAKKALKESQERLRALSAHLQTVREEERSNISREIHDDLGQLLTGLKMDLSWILRHPNPDPGELKEKATAMGQVIDQTVQTVRRISTELRPRILDDFGLVAALEWQAEEFSKKTGIVCRFRAIGGPLELKPDLSIAVFRIFQEALTNVARHSGATRVEASIQKKAGDLVLKIRDNGRGISDNETLRSKSLGLVGMRERALILGGAISIEGKRGKGTTVILRLPIVEKNP